MRRNVDRALAAKRESQRVALRETFDVQSDRDWCELLRDVVAMANAGGGAILFGVDLKGRPSGRDVSAAGALERSLPARLDAYAESRLDELEIVPALKDGVPVVALVVGAAPTPMVFSRACTFETGAGKAGTVFERGALLFRHGAKSRSATTEDLAAAVERRVSAIRKAWLSAVKRIVHAPEGSSIEVLPPEIKDSDSPDAIPIRVVDDPSAPAYRVVDYDRTHPYRQKELLAAFRERAPERSINQFDLLSVRHVHRTDENPEFSHRSLYGTRQYSERFLNWLLENASRDPHFFESARAEYLRRRQR